MTTQRPHLLLSNEAIPALKTALEIIELIPAKNIHLRNWYSNKGSSDLTADIKKQERCPGTWLLSDPRFGGVNGKPEIFVLRNIKDKFLEPVIYTKKERISGSLTLSKVLHISPQAAAQLFSKVNTREAELGLNDKEIWKLRVNVLITKVAKMNVATGIANKVSYKTAGMIQPHE